MNNNFYDAHTPVNEYNMEINYLDNLLKVNKGKVANVYMCFPESNEWRDKIFKGVIEQSYRDSLILSDPSTGKWFVLPLIYINYIAFDEAFNNK